MPGVQNDDGVEKCSHEVEHNNSCLLIVWNEELLTSLTRDWADQQQLIDVMLLVIQVSLIAITACV